MSDYTISKLTSALNMLSDLETRAFEHWDNLGRSDAPSRQRSEASVIHDEVVRIGNRVKGALRSLVED